MTPDVAFPFIEMRVSVVVCAFNEERSLPSLLTYLMREELDPETSLEVICVLSGCTDRTVPLARALAADHPEVRIIEEPIRTGKAAALTSGLLSSSGDVIFVVNADTLPTTGFIRAAVRCFQDPEVALVCSHIAPANCTSGFTPGLGQCLWAVHHEICLSRPHAGEAFAFRGPGFAIPANVQDDDEFVQWWVTRHRGRAVYLPFPVVHNLSPTVFSDYVRQRFRVARQYVKFSSAYDSESSSKNPTVAIPAIVWVARKRPDLRGYLVAFAILELCVGLMARIREALRTADLTVWDPIVTSKGAISSGLQDGVTSTSSPAVGRPPRS
jgi:cellulose synthase/poly-beta-1,6-N-acetylglucosamine synthase-like glycosyltransferase